MIWVIGDIHGMLDPLKRLLSSIRRLEEKNDPIEKIIFIGDYIDHGPSSKEVMDLLLRLEHDKVLICGNHEDMALNFINNHLKYLYRYGNIWFGNGATHTYASIFDISKFNNLIETLYTDSDNYFRGDYHRVNFLDYNGLKLPKKYEQFLKNLQYVHREIINVGDQQISFTFCHGLPRWDQTLTEQRIKTYDDFRAYMERPTVICSGLNGDSQFKNYPDKYNIMRIPMDENFIWGRDYAFRYGYQGDVIIHGHTPTIMYKQYYVGYNLAKQCSKQFISFYSDVDWPFLFSRDPEAGYEALDASGQTPRRIDRQALPFVELGCRRRFVCNWPYGLEAVNIDTGAVYGGALTALGLSSKYLAHGLMPLLTVKTRGNRGAEPLTRTIEVDGFGGPFNFPEKPEISDYDDVNSLLEDDDA
ncbi:MAG: metallophosphoesterase [Deltaproteobacteria bacterium]|jgi:predicted phosphodiesterase|nr:metallophosphoesterase [Deltaproteobacteria bacterium]